MEIEYYFRLLRKWLWLIVAAAFVGAGIGFIQTTRQLPYYSAQATISVGQYIQDPNPTSAQIFIGQNLVATYQQLVETRDVLQGVVDALKLPMRPEGLRGLITTDVITGTSLITIRVTYDDPILTADIANEVANQLIAHSPTNLTAEQQTQVDLATSQIQSLNTQVTQQRTQKDQLDKQIAASQDQSEIAALKQQESELVTQINQAVSTIAQFQTTISNLQQRSNAISIVDRAVIPSASGNTGSPFSTLAGGLTGAVLAFGLALALDYFDDKIRTPQIATQVLTLPVLGVIPRFGKGNASYTERLLTQYTSMSVATEAYRRLRTNLVFTADQDNRKVFVVTSAGPGEGKSITAANLSVILAASGMRVLLIDADMRRPTQHKIFSLSNTVGLSTLLFVEPGAVNEADSYGKSVRNLDECLQKTEIPNLKVIACGFVPTNPTEIVGSALMKRWVDAFRASSNIDVIVIDTPPSLMFSDSSILAALVNADVLFVIDSEKTRRNAALQAREQLQQVGATIKGVVLNRFNPHSTGNYYGEYYVSYYPGETPPKRGWRRWIGR